MPLDSISPGRPKSEDEHRRDLCVAGRWLRERGYLAASDGNLSVRLDERRILASPTGVNKGMMQPQDMVVTDLAGKPLSAGKPSTEMPMHLAIYRQRPDVSAVCHAHPPAATGFAAAGLALDPALLAEAVVMFAGPRQDPDAVKVPLAPYATPGAALAESIRPLVAEHQAILLANHGAVTFGEDILAAWNRMETIEQLARVSLVTRLLGREQVLSPEAVGDLLSLVARLSSQV